MSSAPTIAAQAETLAVNLIAVLVAVTDDQPRILTIGGSALPSGPFELAHRSLQSGLRDWVEQQTHHPIGYVEQLYTFADRDRGGDGDGLRMVSISYLGLTRERPASRTPAPTGDPEWRDWYAFFPWEDRRQVDEVRATALAVALQAWVGHAPDARTGKVRAQRCAIAFGLDGHGWNEDLVLQRYELLFEAALIPEAHTLDTESEARMGLRMTGDHRRILATGMARLRAKIKYRPVVFELLPETFTLLQLQRSVEALAGRLVHKQNFRRLIEQQDLVEEIGALATDTGGRPAKLVRFRRDILDERAMVGTKLPRP
ncbi:hypothetical protein [Beijerinckia sp. L45]|uniref:NUDIX hydrolase n=1 Tax=Beijerinckia sp. L45 TaxID=1641855 RepID=UPI00131CF912|nr:hypothetical protein [Beijerinckia sp. L45]